MSKLLFNASAVALLLSLAPPGYAADYLRLQTTQRELAAIATLATDSTAPIADVFAAAAPFGLEFAAAAPAELLLTAPAIDATGVVSQAPLGLVLAQLAQQAGSMFQVDLRAAQSVGDAKILVVGNGRLSLAQLYDAVEASAFPQAVSKSGAAYVLHQPLAIWTGGVLELTPGETLLMDRTAGAFLMVGGDIVAHGATIGSTGAANANVPAYDGFVVIAMSGSGQFTDTTFKDLGFTNHRPMTGLTFLQGGLYPAGDPSFVENSRFVGTGSLALLGAQHVTISNTIFAQSGGPTVLLDGASYAEIAHNVFSGTAASHSIKITSSSHDVSITDNIMLSSALNGVFADAGSSRINLQRNLVAGSGRSGISLSGTNCLSLANNKLLNNAGSGLLVRQSAGIYVLANSITDNGGAGIAVVQQFHASQVLLTDNQISGNKVGVTGTAPAQLVLTGNNFSGQTPRLLSGELAPYAGALLGNSLAASPVLTIEGADAGLEQSSVALPNTVLPIACNLTEGV